MRGREEQKKLREEDVREGRNRKSGRETSGRRRRRLREKDETLGDEWSDERRARSRGRGIRRGDRQNASA